ncbi:MAG: glycosyltransferase family 39 protein [Chloroflexi bacterium]|nr:glycosyltransferase family 39 protein [Chloroflexota bacterium]
MHLEPAPNPRWPGRRTEAIALLVILALAALFRLYHIETIPPGFTHDEAGHGADAIAITQGARPIYETVGYGREPLYDYIVAALMPIFGQSYLVLRLVSVAAGLALIVLTHFWVRRAFDVPTALATSASLAVSFWAISTSRQALRSELLPVLFMACLYFVWRGIWPHERQIPLLRVPPRLTRWINFIVAGLFLGLSLYTYMAARVLPAILALLWIYLLIFQRDKWRQNWHSLLLVIVIGVALAAPMFAYLAQHPGTEARLTQLSGPIDQLVAGKPEEVLGNALSALGMFSVSGDNLWLYNVPGRPILDWPLAIMFYAGLVFAFIRFRRPNHALILFWLAVAISPSLLTGVVASSLRSIAAQPIVYLLVGIGYVELARFIDRVVSSHTVRSIPLVLLIITVMVYTYHDYFDVWGQAHDVRVAYHTNLSEMARYLDRASTTRSDVAVSSIYPNRFHDPYSMRLVLGRKDLSLRWFTGSFVDMTGAPHASLVFPTSINAAACGEVGGEVRCSSGVTTASVFTTTAPAAIGPGSTTPSAPANYTVDVLLPAIAPIDPAFAEVFNRHARKIETVELRPDDFNPRFEAYEFDATAALSEALKSGVTVTRTLDFDHSFNLIGYDVRARQVKAGATVDVITYWRITSITSKELVLFTHVLSGQPDRPVLAQQDTLDVPSWYWIPGDAFAQLHRFVIPPDTAPGEYALEVGAYTPQDNQRVIVFDDGGNPLSDHVLIGSITVIP